MGWNAEEKASYFLNALEDMKAMLTDFDNAEDWEHAKTTARCLAWLSGNENWFEVSHEYWKKQQQKELKEDIAKKEREANNLKRYEDERERRKREAPLGVPLEVPMDCAISRAFLLCFQSKESADKFDNEYFTNFIKALQDIAKGEPIDIRALVPLLKKGWVAMDKDGEWFWYECKPFKEMIFWDSNEGRFENMFFPVNLKPADNWEESLMECGL